jgi:hypothetical protein
MDDERGGSLNGTAVANFEVLSQNLFIDGFSAMYEIQHGMVGCLNNTNLE